MADKKESKSRIIRGFLLLLAGSALLLACKLPIPETAGTLAAYCGGGIVLYGNYCIIFGLLMAAGDKASGG